MATKDCDNSYIRKEEVDDMTTCCICTEIYTDPKVLPCIHTFCMNCLREHGLKSNKGPGDEMPCPICRRLFKIPPEGFSGLPRHFFIERLIQLSTVSDMEDTKRPSTMKEAETKHDELDAIQTVSHKDKVYQRLEDPMRKYNEKPNLIKKFDLGHSVWGLAMLNKELFVVSADSEVIFVYDSVSYKRLRKLSLGGLVTPRDIAACPQKNCLIVVTIIIFGSSLICIDHKGKILKQWKVHYEPHNLSVMPSGNILLTCNARILIYSSEGNLIQDLSLDAKALDMSWQSVMSKTGNYIVCQGWMGSKHHRVLSLSPEGVILKSFGSRRQCSNSHLSNPVFMAMDSDGLVFVADSGNNRVVLLSQELLFMKELLNEGDDVTEPYRVLFDEDKGLLYVGTNNRQLLIFNVFK